MRLPWKSHGDGAWAAILGYGYFFGVLSTTLLMRLWDQVGLDQSFLGIGATLSLVTAVGWWVAGTATASVAVRSQAGVACFGWAKLLVVLLAGVLALRLASIVAEVVWRPLYPWDAWWHWAAKAKVWVELRDLVAFVPPQQWLGQTPGTQPVYTIDAWNYPPTVPLIQTWMGLALGRWDDSLINLPWVQCLVAMALALYGQSRQWGASALQALVFVYLLASMPMVDTHAALAGYADIWLGAFYLLAFMSFSQWLRSGERSQLILAAVFAAGCTQIKVPGLVWSLTFLPALGATLLSRRWLAAISAVTLVAVVVTVTVGGFSVELPGVGDFKLTAGEVVIPYLGRYVFDYHPAWRPLGENLFVLANWHLMVFMVLAQFVLALPRLLAKPEYRVMTLPIATGFLFLAIVFFFTDEYRYAADYSIVNRAILHMVPALVFFALVLYRGLLEPKGPLANTTCPSDDPAQVLAPGREAPQSRQPNKHYAPTAREQR